MKSILPSNYVPTDETDQATPDKYFALKKLKDGESTTIRLCGTANSGHCVAGYQYFTMEGKPRRFPVFPKDYLEDIGLTYEGKTKGTGERATPSYFLAWVIKRKDVEGYQVFDITQAKVREAIENVLGIDDYDVPEGQLANFYLQINRTGLGTDTKYGVTPVLKAPTAAEAKQWKEASGGIWLPALFNGGDPFQGRPSGESAPPSEPVTVRDQLGADRDLGSASEEQSAESW